MFFQQNFNNFKGKSLQISGSDQDLRSNREKSSKNLDFIISKSGNGNFDLNRKFIKNIFFRKKTKSENRFFRDFEVLSSNRAILPPLK